MGSKKRGSAKAKTEMFLLGLKDRKPGAVPAIVILFVLVVTLAIFKVVESADSPTMKAVETGSAESTAAPSTTIPPRQGEILQANLDKIIETTKTRPFKAKISTQDGFKGYWTQSGTSYRFEDASRAHVIILNAQQKRLWSINVPGKVAHEIPFFVASAEYFDALIPALFTEGISTATVSGTRHLEDILPGGPQSRLSFTKQGLPDRWEGVRSDGTSCFVDWDYVQLGEVAPAEFELPKGITVQRPAPVTPTTTKR